MGLDLNPTTGRFDVIKDNCKDIKISKLAGATWKKQCDFNKLFGSVGRATGGTISESGGVITVGAGTGFIKKEDDDTADLFAFDWAEETGFSVDVNTIKYFGVKWNSVTEAVEIMETDNESDFDLDTSFPLGQVIHQADEYYVLNNPWWVTDGTTNIIERFGSFGHLQRDAEVGGLIPGYSGIRYLTMSGGKIWGRLVEHIIPNFTSVGDVADFDMYYRDSATTWAELELYQWNNTQYNPITGVNAYTLQTISNNQYSVIWIWVNVSSGKPILIFPQQTYSSSAGAEAEAIPEFPAMWYKGGIIIGRFIVKQGVDNPVEVQSVFTQQFNSTQASDHGNLSGLLDDDHPQYIKDSEFTKDSSILVGTGAGTFAEEDGATLRTSIGCDPAGTDNSVDVTLSATLTDILALTSQALSAVDKGADAVVGWDESGSKLTYLSAADVRAAIDVDAAGTDNSTDVTIGASPNGLSLDGQELSLALADTDTIGALSDTDWDTFNNKQDALIADTDYLTPGTAALTYEPIKGDDDNYVTDVEKGNLHAPNSDDQSSSDFNLSDLGDVIDTAKAEDKIIKVDSDGNHIYVDDESGTDEKVKFNVGDPTAGYVADKVIAGDGVSVAEGTGASENKLVVTNTDKGSDVDLSSYLTDITGESIGDLADVDLSGSALGKILKVDGSGNLIIADDDDTTYVAGDFDIKDLADTTNKMSYWDAKLDAGGWYDALQNTIALSGFSDDLVYENPLTFGTGLTRTVDTINCDITQYVDADAIAAIKGDGDWNASDWDTAFGWGNHASAGYLTDITAESLGDLDDVDLTGLADEQIIKYNSTSGKFEVADESGGGSVSPLTTKGDLYGYDTDDARLPVGDDGQVLKADSTETLGVKWDDISSVSLFVFDETPTETPNGTIINFSSDYVFSKIEVFKNGVKMTVTNDFTIDGDYNGITFVTAPPTGSVIRFFYLRADEVIVNFGDYGAIGAETPSGLVNSSNTTYDTANNYIAGTIKVYLNGQRLTKTEDYTETDTNTIEMVTAPVTGDILRVDYDRYLPPAGNASTLDGQTKEDIGVGWIEIDDAFAFASDDDPTYTITIPTGGASKYSPGMRIKLTQPTDGVKYFLVTAVADTVLTVYGGTDYDLDNEAITSPCYSGIKAPLGFPLSPAKWTIEVTDAGAVQASPSQNTWYNSGSASISCPIGVWEVQCMCNQELKYTLTGAAQAFVTLSTTTSSETNTEFTSMQGSRNKDSADEQRAYCTHHVLGILTLTVADIYYFLQKTNGVGVTEIELNLITLRLKCAYL